MVAEKDKLLSENAALARELAAAKEIVDKFRIQGLSEDELRRLNPAVATTIASLKRGRSLTEIYSDYVQVSGSFFFYVKSAYFFTYFVTSGC